MYIIYIGEGRIYYMLWHIIYPSLYNILYSVTEICT